MKRTAIIVFHIHVLGLLQVFLSVLDTPVCEHEQESLDEALSRVNSDIDSLPMLTDFPIGTLTVMYNQNFTVHLIYCIW